MNQRLKSQNSKEKPWEKDSFLLESSSIDHGHGMEGLEGTKVLRTPVGINWGLIGIKKGGILIRVLGEERIEKSQNHCKTLP